MAEDKCDFDWEDFHKKLDIASAHMIQEKGILPSKTSLLDFMSYSHDKKKAGGCFPKQDE